MRLPSRVATATPLVPRTLEPRPASALPLRRLPLRRLRESARDLTLHHLVPLALEVKRSYRDDELAERDGHWKRRLRNVPYLDAALEEDEERHRLDRDGEGHRAESR